MTRKQAMGIAIIVLTTLVVSVLAVAIMPVWLTALMIKPRVGNGASDYVMKRMTREMTKMMFRRHPYASQVQ